MSRLLHDEWIAYWCLTMMFGLILHVGSIINERLGVLYRGQGDDSFH